MKTNLLIALAAMGSAHASVVGWNFDNFSTVNGAKVAGIVPAANWNNSYPSNPTTNLIDDAGQATTLDISYSPTNSSYSIAANHPGADADGSYNKELMNGYLNAGGTSNTSVTLSQIPYPNYRIIVYFSADVANRNGTVKLTGGPTYDFKSVGPATRSGSNALLTQTTSTDLSRPAANYAIFTGLSGATQTVSVNIALYGGIAGVQVVADLSPQPLFGLQPASQQKAVNSTVTFTASASSDPAPTYQWEYSADGNTGWTPLIGQTSASLAFGVTASDEGYYHLVATNTNGSATSDAAFLDTYHTPPAILTQPVGASAAEGSSVQLWVSATGYETLSYQWYKDGDPLNGETSDTLNLSNIDAADAGIYFVEVADSVEPGLTRVSSTATVVTFPAWNGLVSQDSFVGYTSGELPPQNPSVTGYTGAWTDIDYGDAEPEILAGSLSYADPLYLGSSGDQVGKAADAVDVSPANSGRTYRKLAPALVVAGNTTGTRYLSWIYQNGNQNAAARAYNHSTLGLYHNTGGVAPAGDASRRVFTAGISTADYGSTRFGFRYNQVQVGDLVKPVDSAVHLFVAKFDLSDAPGGDSITVWIDPVLGAGDPAGGVTMTGLDVEFESLAFSEFSSNSSAWDELRWGSSFDSVSLKTNLPGFQAWIDGYHVNNGLDGVEDDADHDGILNGIENFFGTDPSASTTGISQVTRSGSTVTFQHPQGVTLASDLTAAYRWSTDLSTWNDNGATSGGTTVSFASSPNTPTTGITTVTATITGTIPARFFTDIKVTQAP